MEEEDVNRLVQAAISKLKNEMSLELEKIKEENVKGKEEIQILRDENTKIKKQMEEMERMIDDIEQYSRKDCLILSGGGMPEVQTGKYEAPEETREVAKKVIEEKLGVTLNGRISACHRLRNNKRVLVKFQDSDDRSAVYESKFNQSGVGQKDRVTIHENLTAKRAKQIQVLGDMWDKGEIANYYTKYGQIMARKSRDQRYVMIRADMTRDEIISVTEQAAAKVKQQAGNQSDNFLRSQTLTSIPAGRVAGQRADLEQARNRMSTRSAGRGRGSQGQGRSSD